MKILCTAQMGAATIMGQAMRVIAIAKTLQRRGHDVRFIAAGKLIPVIRNFGLDVLEADNMPDIQHTGTLQDLKAEPSEATLTQMKELLEKMVELERTMAKKVCPDLIVSGTVSGATVARSLGIPSALVFLQPHGQKTVQMVSKVINRQGAAEKQTGTSLQSMLGAADLIIMEGMPELGGDLAMDFFGAGLGEIKEKIRFCGPLLVESPDQLPDRFLLKQKHLGNGERNLAYITIGGGSPLIGEQFLATVLKALQLTPDITGVVATGLAISPNTIKAYRPPVNAMVKGFVPGTELIKASDVTVFHGGSSTLMSCIACGSPAVVIPSMGEQEDNAAVMARFQAGIVLEKASLTPDKLAEAMRTVIRSESYRTGAQALKRLGDAYGGAEEAANWVEQLAGGVQR